MREEINLKVIVKIMWILKKVEFNLFLVIDNFKLRRNLIILHLWWN